MLTVAETELFSRYAADYWTEAEHGEFVAWIAKHPEAGDVIPGSGGSQGALDTQRHGQAWRCQGYLFQSDF
jgi:hypothetical protein